MGNWFDKLKDEDSSKNTTDQTTATEKWARKTDE